MAIGTSLGAYFDDAFHHQAGINTDPSQDRIDVDPDVDSQSTKPKPKLDIMPISDVVPADDTAATMASRASEKAMDALKSAKGTPPTIDEDTGIKGPILHNIEVGGQRYAMTQDDADTAQSIAMAVSGGGLASKFKAATTYEQRFGMNPEQAANNYHNLPQGENILFAHHYEEHSAPHEWNAYENMVNDPLRQVPFDSRGHGVIVANSPHVGEGPSPFEQVTGASRRSATLHPDLMSDEEFYHHGLLQAPGTMTAEQEARWARVDSNPPFRASVPESFDQLMDRLDHQDQARMDAVPSNQFKDYGKVQVANGERQGQFLFKAGDSKVLPLNISERENGKLLYVNWMGGSKYDANTFNKGTVKGLFKALADKYPDAEEIAGFRISGARISTGGGPDTARMRIPDRGKPTLPRKSIEDLSSEWDDAAE